MNNEYKEIAQLLRFAKKFKAIHTVTTPTIYFDKLKTIYEKQNIKIIFSSNYIKLDKPWKLINTKTNRSIIVTTRQLSNPATFFTTRKLLKNK